MHDLSVSVEIEQTISITVISQDFKKKKSIANSNNITKRDESGKDGALQGLRRKLSGFSYLLQLYPLALLQYASAAGGNRWRWDNHVEACTYYRDCNKLVLPQLDLRDLVPAKVSSYTKTERMLLIIQPQEFLKCR